MNQPPIAIGLSLCEQVVIEEKTRNLTLVNCFNHRRVSRFPSEEISFIVLALLTDGLGDMTIDLVIYRSDTMEEVFRRSNQVQLASPLNEYRLRVGVEKCSFPTAGSYHVSLLADNELIAQRRLKVLPRRSS
jgi:hypothetical protein